MIAIIKKLVNHDKLIFFLKQFNLKNYIIYKKFVIMAFLINDIIDGQNILAYN